MAAHDASVRRDRIAAAAVRVVAGLAIAANAMLFVLKAPGAFQLSTHLFALWLMLAWIVVLVVGWWRYVPGLLAGVLVAAALELAAFFVTFIAPHGATTALVFATKPIWQIALIAVAIGVARLLRRANAG
jgi:hypothetical protein